MHEASFGIAQAFTTWYGITVMSVIGCLSIYMVALIFVRWVFFRLIKTDSQRLLNDTQMAVARNDVKQLTNLRNVRPSDSPVRILIGLGLSNTHFSAQDLTELFAVTRIRQRSRLTRGLSAFGTMATIAPFIGLLGTVIGIVQCFQSLAVSGAAGPNVVASGVAEALWATAAGLVVAIPSVVAYNIFKNKSQAVMTDMEVVSRELVLMLKTEKQPKLKAVGMKED